MRQKHYIPLLNALCVFLFIFLSYPLPAKAQQDTVIRVGVFDYEAFYGTDALGNPYGYGYEYLETLAKYGGFSYEYVSGSWSECLEWLASGEIDMLDSAQKSPDRQNTFLFSEYSTGTSYGELFVRSDNTTIPYHDFSAMDGLTIGMLEGNSRNKTFFDFAESNGFSFKTIYYQTADDLSSALQNNTVNAIVSSNLRKGENESSVARFSPTPFYMMFHQEQTQLKSMVDTALEEILVDNPAFNSMLYSKYYAYDNITPTFTRQEQELIQKIPVLKAVYNENRAPFSFFDPVSKKPKGIHIDMLMLIGQKTGLKFEFIGSSSQLQAAEMVSSGQADLLLGFEATTQRESSLGLTATDDFMSAPLCLIGRYSTTENGAVFTVPANSEEMILLLKDQFPSSPIIVLETADECYQSVLDGEADFTMDNVYAAASAMNGDETRRLIISFVSPAKDYYSLGLSADADPALIRVLNKGIASVSTAELTSVFSHHTLHTATGISFAPLLYEYRIILIIVLVAFLFFSIGATWLLLQKQKKKKAALWQSAYIDPLTGLGNSKLFEQEMRSLLDSHPNKKYFVCRFDIENLQLLNEIYGFDSGDKIIQCLANEIRYTAIPDADACARITGDDFILLKSYTDVDNSLAILDDNEQRIRQWINHQFSCLVSLKHGVYYINDNSESTSSILEKTSYAHSICKVTPALNCYCYDEADKQNAIEEKKIEAMMEEALERRQFLLYLQPKYLLTDESMAGAEALVRWYINDTRQLIYPNSFIPLFEKNGFILQLDMYMLEEVCKLIKNWIENGLTPITVSINFSRLHILNPNFAQEICDMVDRYQVPRKHIEIELTESAMFDNEEAMFAVLESLHEEGFTLSMDDFGTGYSSLGLLKNLPVDVIKIDRSFFLNSRFKTRAKAVIENVMQMAKRLKIHTVAEGVESQEHIDMLRDMGCEIVQGFYYSKPMPVSEFRLDGKAQPDRTPYVEPRVDAFELGDLSLGRADMDQLTSVFAYRLYHVSLRKTLINLYGTGEMVFTLRSVGKLAGGMFARELLDLSLPFDDFLLSLGEKLAHLKMGLLSVERLDLESCSGIITISDDLGCSGGASCSQTLCQYDEGFFTGVMKEYTQKNYSVIETDCWGTGSNLCRFEIKLK